MRLIPRSPNLSSKKFCLVFKGVLPGKNVRQNPSATLTFCQTGLEVKPGTLRVTARQRSAAPPGPAPAPAPAAPAGPAPSPPPRAGRAARAAASRAGRPCGHGARGRGRGGPGVPGAGLPQAHLPPRPPRPRPGPVGARRGRHRPPPRLVPPPQRGRPRGGRRLLPARRAVDHQRPAHAGVAPAAAFPPDPAREAAGHAAVHRLPGQLRRRQCWRGRRDCRVCWQGAVRAPAGLFSSMVHLLEHWGVGCHICLRQVRGLAGVRGRCSSWANHFAHWVCLHRHITSAP